MTRTRLQIRVVLAVLVGWAHASVAQDLITLRAHATISHDGPPTLADIADLAGDQALKLGSTVLGTPNAAGVGGTWTTVTLDDLRRAMDTVDGINWGRLTLRGSACSVRREGAAPTPAPERDAEDAADVRPTGSTVRALVEKRLREAYEPDAARIRLDFDPGDARLLDTPTEGLTADVQLIGASDRQPVSVTLYRGTSTAASGQARVGVKLLRSLAVSSTSLRRGDPLDEGTFRVEERWIGPAMRPADAGSLVGQFARGRINSGQVIEADDIEPPMVIKKGELVDAVCLSGGVSLKVKARALEPARIGDLVRLQIPDSGRSFQARADGPGRAVTSVGELPAADGDVTPAKKRAALAQRRPPLPGTKAPRAGESDDRRRLRYLDLGDTKLDPTPAKTPAIPTEDRR